MAGSSSSNPREYYQYPYPSHVFVANFVSVKLSGRDNYGVWKTQMLCLLKSHDMFGFINGTFRRPPQNSVPGKEKVGDYMLWERSDELVKGWILGSLSEQTLRYVVNLVKSNEDFTAKDVWDKLQTIYGPDPVPQQAAAADLHVEQYPYPSNVFVPSFVSVKLSGRDMYGVWKTQMSCLLESHGMLGFIDGTINIPNNKAMGKEKVGATTSLLKKRSDALVKGWILGSLSEQTLRYIVNLVKKNDDFTAKDVWDKLHTICGPAPPQQAAAAGASIL